MNIKARTLEALRRADEHVADEKGRLDRGKAQLEWYPLHPGTVTGRIGHVAVHDDTDGHLRSQDNYAVADINYLNGKIEIEPPFRLLADVDYLFSYFFDCRKNAEIERYAELLVRVPRQRP